MAHSHAVHLPLGALLIRCTVCGTGASPLPLPHLPHRCSAERNEATPMIERWARSVGKDAYLETVRRFNCTGTDYIEKPKVDLRPPHFLEQEGACRP